MADSSGTSSFSLDFFHEVLELHDVWVDVKNTSQLTSTVEFWFLDRATLLFHFSEPFDKFDRTSGHDRAWMYV